MRSGPHLLERVEDSLRAEGLECRRCAPIPGAGQQVRLIVTATCIETGFVEVFTYATSTPEHYIIRQFKTRGWELGKRPRHLLSCKEKRVADIKLQQSVVPATALRLRSIVEKVEPMSKPEEKVVGDQSNPVKSAENSVIKNTMRVARLLDEHFIEGRYAKGWSDQAVADKLALAVAFIAQVRDSEFGPIKGDPDVEALRADLSSIIEMATDLKKRIDALEKRRAIA